MDVHQVEWHRAQQALQRPADVEGKWRRPPPWAARQGDALTDGENARVRALEQSPGVLAGLPNQPTALANRRSGVGRRDDQDPVSAPRELLRGPGNELVDLVPASPRVGADLRDRKGI